MKKTVKNYLIIGLSLGVAPELYPQLILQNAKSLAISCGLIEPKAAEKEKDAREHFSEQLVKQEKATWQELEKIGIMRSQFENAKRELQKEFKNVDMVPANSKSVSPEMAQIINNKP
jgi:hypothetical protein